MSRDFTHPGAFWSLWKIVRGLNPDILQTWLYHADLLGLLAGKMAAVPRVVWNLRCSDMGDGYYRGTSGLIVRALARLSPGPTP